MYKALQSPRLYEQIVRQIEESIRAGELTEGSQLPAERDLAKQFGVSRTAVREAIKSMQESGLVDALPGRGTFIANGNSKSMRRSLDRIMKSGRSDGWDHLVEVREILEPEIAALAAVRADAEDIKTMREAVFTMDNAAWDSDAYIEADLDFHLALAEAAGNPIVLSLIDSIVEMLREQRSMIFRVAGGPQRGQQHHRLILEAIRRRDPQSARTEMQAHLLQIREDSRKTTSTQDSGPS